MMWMEQFKRMLFGMVLGLVLCVFVLAASWQGAPASPSTPQEPPKSRQPINKPAAEQFKPVNRIFLVKDGQMVSVETTGVGSRSYSNGNWAPYNPVWSPDGKQVAYGRRKPYIPPPNGQSTPQDLLCDVYIKSTTEKGKGKKLAVKADYFRWTRDGKALLLAAIDSGDLTSWMVDVRTGEVTSLDLPKRHIATDVTRDGK